MRTSIVTGGAKGIGKGIVSCFIENGYNVMITGRDESSLIQCVNDMENVINSNETLNNKISYYVGDVSIKKSCEDMILQCVIQYGQLDVLVCNAGIYPEATVEAVTEEEINETMRINYNGTVFCIQSSIPLLKQSQAGRIIIISSITGPITGNIGFAHYAASKAAQIGFMRTVAMELAPFNITVNAILPGNILTDGLESLGSDYICRMERKIPMKRLGTPLDIGNAAVFLASPLSSYITGNLMTIDGGQVLPED